eukprot:356379-Chlamydomonas_euryale.AAC.7
MARIVREHLERRGAVQRRVEGAIVPACQTEEAAQGCTRVCAHICLRASQMHTKVDAYRLTPANPFQQAR